MTLSLDIRFRRKAFDFEAKIDIPEQGICVLLGPSGAGKSTLLRLIAGLEQPNAGQIKFGGQTWFDGAARINKPLQQRRVGMVFQDYALFETMTVADNIGYGAPRRHRAAATAAWMSRLGLDDLAARYPAQLSGGQRQRVALARALAADPDILLLDEPFSAVDAHLRDSLRTQLTELSAAVRKPVVLVTHDLDEARRLADTVAVIAGGRLRRFGATTAVFDDPGEFAAATVLGWRNILPLTPTSPCLQSSGAISSGPNAARWFGIRPEHVALGAEAPDGVFAYVVRVLELGAVRELQCRLPAGPTICVHRPWNAPLPAAGERVRIAFPPQWVRLFGEDEPLTGLRIGEASIPVEADNDAGRAMLAGGGA